MGYVHNASRTRLSLSYYELVSLGYLQSPLLCFIIFHIALSYLTYSIMVSSLSIYFNCHKYNVISTEKGKLLSTEFTL